MRTLVSWAWPPKYPTERMLWLSVSNQVTVIFFAVCRLVAHNHNIPSVGYFGGCDHGSVLVGQFLWVSSCAYRNSFSVLRFGLRYHMWRSVLVPIVILMPPTKRRSRKCFEISDAFKSPPLFWGRHSAFWSVSERKNNRREGIFVFSEASDQTYV